MFQDRLSFYLLVPLPQQTTEPEREFKYGRFTNALEKA